MSDTGMPSLVKQVPNNKGTPVPVSSSQIMNVNGGPLNGSLPSSTINSVTTGLELVSGGRGAFAVPVVPDAYMAPPLTGRASLITEVSQLPSSPSTVHVGRTYSTLHGGVSGGRGTFIRY